MAVYIATFFSHYSAIRFGRALKQRGIAGTLMPIPRALSSSCGTCVRFSAESDAAFRTEDIERIFRMENGKFTQVFSSL